MALQTALAKLLDSLVTARGAVRIVAGRACQPSFALLEASRLPQPIRSAVDFKLVVVTSPGSVIEMNQIVTESLAGSERIGRPAENPHSLWQIVAGGLQMTLLTDIHLTQNSAGLD